MLLENTIISWPQSGRTWLITMIGKIFADCYNQYDLTNFSIYGFGKDIKNLGEYNLHTFPREHEDQAWTKTPDELLTSKNYLNDMYGKDNRVPIDKVNCIFLVRDPRDTLVSNYNRRLKIKNPNTNFRGTASEFIRSDKGSLKSMIKWLNIWAKNFHKCNDYYIVKYEDLHYDCFNQMRNIINFIGYDEIPNEYINKAIDFAMIDNMRSIEQKEGNVNHSMFSKNINFVGDGKIGKGWKFFNTDDNEYISKYIKMLNPIYGYGE